jgi:hypothetical protein
MNALTGALLKTSSAMTSRQSLKWGGNRNVMVNCSHLPNKHLTCSLLSIATYPFNRTCPSLELRSSFFALPATAWRICALSSQSSSNRYRKQSTVRFFGSAPDFSFQRSAAPWNSG